MYGVLRGHEDDPAASALALRLMGAVHRLVLTGEVAELTGLSFSTRSATGARSSAS